MRKTPVIRRRLLAVCLLLSMPHLAAAAPVMPVHFTVPGLMSVQEGAALPYENGFFLVPENRGDPQSRLIAIRYLRFPAQTSEKSKAPPVVMLPGGPGSLIDEAALRSWPDTIHMIRHVTRTRDYVVLQQRGVKDGNYAANISFPVAALPLDRIASAEDQRERLRKGVSDGIASWKEKGVDLRGYNVLEMVADLDDLRRVLGTERFVLYGTSFGSQWGLSYLKLHQDHVERTVLTGLEPLNYTYDSPQGLWRTYQRIGARAAASDALATELRGTELTAIYQRVAQRLERQPQLVEIADPHSGLPVQVKIDAEDLRRVLYPLSGSLRRNAEAWPRFLLELDRGDYRYLATLALRQRDADEQRLMGLLIDNSLGITAKRDAALRREPASRWLGDVNAGYTNTRDLTPTANVGDDFRADFDLHIPALLIQGDTDLSTPMENALSQKPHLKNGRLVIVEGGTHQVRAEVLTPSLMAAAPGFGDAFLEFVAPTTGEPAAAALSRFPERVRLAPFDFQSMTGPSLYEQSRKTP